MAKYTERLWAARDKKGRWISEFGGLYKKLRHDLVTERKAFLGLEEDGDKAVQVTVTYEVEDT